MLLFSYLPRIFVAIDPISPASRYPRYTFARSGGARVYTNGDKRSPEDEDTPAQTGGTKETQEQRKADADVQKLAARDREVRNHEAAHMAAAGSLVKSGPTFKYQRGPDGKLYAVGGEVRLDTSSGRTPEETLAKARQIRGAALAPSDPSSQDMAVASQASALETAAQQDMTAQTARSLSNNRSRSSVSSGFLRYQQSLFSSSSSTAGLWALA